LAVLFLAGCAHQPPPTITLGQVGGTVAGGAAGAAIGRASTGTVQGTVVGAAMGALIGMALGNYFDPSIEARIGSATAQAAGDGSDKAVAWHDGGDHGSVTPVGSSYQVDGRPCRALRQDQVVGGKPSVRHVVACETAQGVWEVVDARPPASALVAPADK
jgi:surface antigen